MALWVEGHHPPLAAALGLVAGAQGAHTLSARGGDQRVVLEPAYVATATQLGYATTDYGNQGVTTERSLTWVGEATSAAGLYVATPIT